MNAARRLITAIAVALPCGLAFGSASGMVGTPVEFEKRTVTGTGLIKCGALLRLRAFGEGVNVPVAMTPLAWLARKPACGPPEVLFSASTSAAGKGLGSSCAQASCMAGVAKPKTSRTLARTFMITPQDEYWL